MAGDCAGLYGTSLRHDAMRCDQVPPYCAAPGGVIGLTPELFVVNPWTAEKVCIDVRFRDRSRIFLDVEEVGFSR